MPHSLLSSIHHARCSEQTNSSNGLLSFDKKNRKHYLQAFEELKQLNPCLEPSKVLLDFKKAPIKAFHSAITRTIIEGCFFHFVQANWRKIQKLGLASLYRTNERLRLLMKSFIALALVPH